ncbi:restriction endonuclease [Erwinia phyllosphaerae]|uniref:restriction endonuclease n=1 Tax=Erwinia phyllosphaerae TaxID=2853256 RepID=UPI001FEE8433|nr:restriction endonuclease [Erwinia phyllosphaerae]MBV4366500.1 restriction endonuclease [Erwinia phyllosphaerae]
MAGGTDGVATITDTTLLGTDGTSTTRKGMYTLHDTNSQVINLVDLDSHHGTTFAYSDGMSPVEYEAYCAEVLKENGGSARTTKASGDQGVDVMAEINGNTVAIQCKKYSRPISNSAVQEVSSGAKFWGPLME